MIYNFKIYYTLFTDRVVCVHFDTPKQEYIYRVIYMVHIGYMTLLGLGIIWPYLNTSGAVVEPLGARIRRQRDSVGATAAVLTGVLMRSATTSDPIKKSGNER